MSPRNSVSTFENLYIPEPNSGCWLWLGYLLSNEPPKQYGRLRWANGKKLAHVLAYELYKGKIPKKKVLDHLCRNTFCVNPDHLEPVSSLINSRRSAPATKTHCKHGHPYANGFEIYVRKDNEGIQYRRCLTCYRRRYPGSNK